ncbi:hypothetical protein [Prosthecobacter sp.]|uniref:anti-sigma factor n=1 Tax=Prosthecobacter sp. TaxID=1965333 RepID=UPI002ABD131A|nr:hypothetical protein [Prosthecobacter sp.]MDZ4401191.1 hypothetical protein [Prosthecobacter sp.]
MKPPSEDHDLIRWLDGEMSEAERTSFEERLKQDPVLAKEAKGLRELSAGIRAHLPAELKVPHEDFFNSQIQVRIAQLEMGNTRAEPNGKVGLAVLFNWLRQPWLFATGAAALAVLSFLLLQPAGDSHSESFILSSYTPNVSVHAHTFHDDAADATVLMLDGLDAIPAERKVSGISVHRTEIDPELASTTFYDASGARVLLLARDATGNPLIWTQAPRG